MSGINVLSVRGCWRKIPYGTEREARLAVTENEAKFHQPFDYYQCDNHYHVARKRDELRIPAEGQEGFEG